MSLLFSPLDFGPLRLSNRIVIAPMCQYSAEEGRATDWHAFHWPNLAQSGAGLAMVVSGVALVGSAAFPLVLAELAAKDKPQG